ncbi:TlpA family protein disulfide reductase [Stutzerimonas stutzeri]
MISRCMGLLACLALVGCSESWGPDARGQEVAGRDLEGDWVLVNYWAEWCGPCRTEIPELNALDASSEDITVLGVNFDELQGEELVAAAEALGIRFRVLSVDPTERLGLSRSAVLPLTVIVGPDGEVRESLVGEQTQEGLLARLDTLRKGG